MSLTEQELDRKVDQLIQDSLNSLSTKLYDGYQYLTNGILHNGNILLHSDGHLIHIDFGFILSISPKNLGFEQSPFKLTLEFVDVMGGASSTLWQEFKHLLLKGLLAARKHQDRIINIMFKLIWQEEQVDLWVRPYKIVCLSNDSGLIEPIPNTVSLHQIKKNSNKSLRDYFIDEHGDPDELRFKRAQRNFMQSCAAYCLISYLLQQLCCHQFLPKIIATLYNR
uniref:Uncharacterized protein n=1 Tax=Phlebotomus papatasi TaxID=29031 RepID=A0A1B0DCK3_PHLPP